MTEREFQIVSQAGPSGMYSLATIATYWGLLLNRFVSDEETRETIARINESRARRRVAPLRLWPS